MNISRNIIIFLFCLLAIPARSQNKIDDLIVFNHNLESDINKLLSDIKQCNDELLNLKNDIKSNICKRDTLLSFIHKLESQTSQKTLDLLQSELEGLKEYSKSLDDSLSYFSDEISRKNELLKKIQSDIRGMAAFSEIKKKRNFDANLSYIQQKFSRISASELQYMVSTCEDFKCQESYQNYRKKLEVAFAYKKLFDEGWQAIESKFDEKSIYSIRVKTTDILNNHKGNMSEEQFSEMDSLDIRLSRYKEGIKEFSKIIDKINTNKTISKIRNERAYSSERLLIDTAREFIIPNEGSEAYKTYQRFFLMIPYLKKMLKAYWNEIKSEPLKFPTSTEKEIINLNVK